MCTLARSRRIDPTTKVYELEKERQFWQPSAETRFACCRPDFSQLLMGHREQPIFAIVPNLVLVQLLGQFLELPLPSSRSRNVAALGPSRSSHRIHAEGCVTANGCLSFSAVYIACFSATCTTPTKSLGDSHPHPSLRTL